MSEGLKTVYGIDLGTTYSCIAYVDEHEKPVVVSNSENESLTPSVVLFDEGNIIVGSVAKSSSRLYPDDTVSMIKRNMGNPNYEHVRADEAYRPEEISSFILRKLVTDAQASLQADITDVVITCPAYFGINEREATKKAGEIAGLNVRAILNEPTAAAIAYGMAEEEAEKVVLIYDLGGGTFDVTIIDIKPESIRVVCTGGDHQLGGKDWDQAIADYLASRFCEQTGEEIDQVWEDPTTSQDLLLNSESAKKTLSQRSKAPVAVTHGGERMLHELEREKFEELTDALFERTIRLTKEMLAEAEKKGYSSFDEILLVGGSCRMPQVAERIEQAFGMQPRLYDPDESVAKGAALYGWKLSINDRLVARLDELNGDLNKAIQEVANETGVRKEAVERSNRTVTNVSSKSFGVVALDQDDQKRVYNLILKNSALPIEAHDTFYTVDDNQDNVLIEIMEDEVSDQHLDPEDCLHIGQGVLDIPAGKEKGYPINVAFRLNEEGRLEIEATEESGQHLEVTIETASVISGEELEKAKSRSTALRVS